jgi:hypothetical protein
VDLTNSMEEGKMRVGKVCEWMRYTRDCKRRKTLQPYTIRDKETVTDDLTTMKVNSSHIFATDRRSA